MWALRQNEGCSTGVPTEDGLQAGSPARAEGGGEEEEGRRAQPPPLSCYPLPSPHSPGPLLPSPRFSSHSAAPSSPHG